MNLLVENFEGKYSVRWIVDWENERELRECLHV